MTDPIDELARQIVQSLTVSFAHSEEPAFVAEQLRKVQLSTLKRVRGRIADLRSRTHEDALWAVDDEIRQLKKKM